MRRHCIAFFICLIALGDAVAQRYEIESSMIRFFSDAIIEDITAENKKAAGLFDSQTSEIVFSVPINEFQFEKSLMKEHFNEKYMESEKYPKSLFKGKISGFDPKRDGAQDVFAIGQLTIHGVTRDVQVPGTILVKGEKLDLYAVTKVKLADYDITIPQMLFQNIAEEVEVTMKFSLKPRHQ